jgi:hypothetical protein
MKIMRMMMIVAVVVMTAGCTSTRPLKGGKAMIKPGMVAELVQPENPAQPARQSARNDVEMVMMIPAGSKVMSRDITPMPENPKVLQTNETVITVSSNTPLTRRVIQRAESEIGAAQKDTAREIGAKLSNLKGVVWVGVGLFLFGLASLVYPPLRAIIGSVTTSMGMVCGGVALMILPTMIVGNELLILGGVAVAVGAWFLAHRHGQLKGMVDANQDGIDDRIEAALPSAKTRSQGNGSES